MKWEKGDDYYWHCREYKISKCFVRRMPRFSAWYQRELLGVFNSFVDADLAVKQHAAGLFPREGITYATCESTGT